MVEISKFFFSVLIQFYTLHPRSKFSSLLVQEGNTEI